MAIFLDPILPKLATPTWDYLKEHPVRFGRYDMTLSPMQWEYTFAPEVSVGWTGGTRCLSAETLIGGIPVAERSIPGMVDTLIGPKSSTASFLKATSTALYRVSTRSQREVVVTLDHCFLSLDGWRPLRLLGVGALIAGHDSDYDRHSSGIGAYSPDRYASDFHPCDELLNPLEVFLRSRSRQLGEHGTSLPCTSLRPYKRDGQARAAFGLNEWERHAERIDAEAFRHRLRNHELLHIYSLRSLDSGVSRHPSVGLFEAALSSSRIPHGESVFAGPEISTNPSAVRSQKDCTFRTSESRQTQHQDSVLDPCSYQNYNMGGWDEIVSIEFVKYGDVYDLTVPDAHHYEANGLYHHNSGKSMGAIARGLTRTLWVPDNKGIVGRLYQTDLQDTDQRDFNDIAEATGMVKHKTDRKLEMYCCDMEGKMLPSKQTSEILFLHFDNINHVKGHGIGWFCVAEASEVAAKILYRLTDRLSHPAAKGKYTGFWHSNPEGRNWCYDWGYNPETVQALVCAMPGCKKKEHPLCSRLMRRAIHNRTKDNPFLSESYLAMQYATSPPEWIRRYMDGEFDVFEGQIFAEFDTAIHCVRSAECAGWDKHEPPRNWPHYLGIDTGGVDPWAFEASAVDPYGNLIFYGEVYRPEVYVGSFEKELNDMISERNFVKVVMDWENKSAQHEINRILPGSVRVNNAQKRGKMNSLTQVARYLHPNPERAFPDWHPRRGEGGSPGVFFTERVRNLVSEMPQQRWKKLQGHDIQLNEMDTRMADHATHAMMYTLRERPKPEEALVTIATKLKAANLDDRSKYYYQLELAEQARKAKTQVGDGRYGALPFARRQEKQPLWN